MSRSFVAACAAIVVWLCGCTSTAEVRVTSDTWNYAVRLEKNGEELLSSADFPAGEAVELSVLEATSRFIDSVRASSEDSTYELERTASGWALAASSEVRRVSWRFDAREAARVVNHSDIASWRGRGFVGSISSFLLRAPDADFSARFRLRVATSSDTSFGCACATSGDGWVGPASDLRLRPACAFGAITLTRSSLFAESKQPLELTIATLEPREEANARAIDDWATRSASAVAAYFGRSPVDRLFLVVGSSRRRATGGGRTRGYGGAMIQVSVNARATSTELRNDWILVHEMVHLALPSLALRQHWLEEGSATYLEPLIRARAGLIREEDVWREMLDEYAQGLSSGSSGLDDDGSWGRTYYGGAIFCLVADIEIRKRTANAKSLQDALTAVVAAGGNVTEDWPIERVLEIGDGAVGTPVLAETYALMRRAPEPRELDSLWKHLGVALDGDHITFDDDAPLANVRQALVLGRRRD